jgi:hypothetical protein
MHPGVESDELDDDEDGAAGVQPAGTSAAVRTRDETGTVVEVTVGPAPLVAGEPVELAEQPAVTTPTVTTTHDNRLMRFISTSLRR